MIIAEQKDLGQIIKMLEGQERVLIAGCRSCVAVCLAGGEKEVSTLAEALRLHADIEGRELDVTEVTLERQCEKEWVREMETVVRDRDIVLIAGLRGGGPGRPGDVSHGQGGARAEHLQHGGAGGAGRLPGEVRRLRGLRPPPDRRRMPGGPMLQIADERPLRRLPERQVRGEPGDALRLGADLPQPGEAGTPGPAGGEHPAQELDALPFRRAAPDRAPIGGPATEEKDPGRKGDEVRQQPGEGPGERAVRGHLGDRPAQVGQRRTRCGRRSGCSRDAPTRFNLTDNQTAIVRLSSLASSVVCLQEGVEPVMQMTCRDRNRIAMQSDLLGAAALGVRNVLCLSGDHQTFGNQKEAKNVYDLDPIQQLMVFRQMRDEGKVWGGDALEERPRLYLGAAANPFADPFEFRVARLAKKVKRRGRFRPDPGDLRPGPLRAVHGPGAGEGAGREGPHPRRGGPATLGQRRQVHEEQGLRHERPGRAGGADEGRRGPQGGRDPDLRGDDRAPEVHGRRPRRPHHGHRLGGDRSLPG